MPGQEWDDQHMGQHLNLRVIPEPEGDTRAVLTKEGAGTVLVRADHSDVTFHCGGCGKPLVVGMHSSQLANLVLKCNQCGAFNETFQ